MIDFTPTEQQLAMKEAARKFAQTELKPLVKEHLSDPWECTVCCCIPTTTQTRS